MTPPSELLQAVTRDQVSEIAQHFALPAAARRAKAPHKRVAAAAKATHLAEAKAPVVVNRMVSDIDEIVRLVHLPGCQQTSTGEREGTKGLRKTLLKYKLHTDAKLCEKAYGYIKECYW